MDRLGVDSIDLYQIHFPGFINEPYWSGLADCYNQGLVKHIGVSNYGPDLLRRAHKYFADRGIQLESNQIQYSLLCRQQETNGALQVGNKICYTFAPSVCNISTMLNAVCATQKKIQRERSSMLCSVVLFLRRLGRPRSKYYDPRLFSSGSRHFNWKVFQRQSAHRSACNQSRFQKRTIITLKI